MDFSSISSIRTYVKTLDSKFQAEQRKQGKAEKKSTIEEWVEKQEESMKNTLKQLNQEEESGSDQRLSDIRTKVQNGASLSNEERAYLKSKDPILYGRIAAADAEKKAFERELKRCRTKEEVQRLRMSHTASSLSAINTIKNNPNIPTAQKLALAQAELYKTRELDKVMVKFVKSGEYADLPTENEKALAEKRVKQAEERRAAELAEKQKPQEPELPKTETEDEPNLPPTSETEKKDKTERPKLPTEEDKKAVDRQPQEQKSEPELQALRDIRPRETVEQAENSREMLKFKRAKAKRAYTAAAAETFAASVRSAE